MRAATERLLLYATVAILCCTNYAAEFTSSPWPRNIKGAALAAVFSLALLLFAVAIATGIASAIPLAWRRWLHGTVWVLTVASFIQACGWIL